jgi:hypothetical protein
MPPIRGLARETKPICPWDRCRRVDGDPIVPNKANFGTRRPAQGPARLPVPPVGAACTNKANLPPTARSAQGRGRTHRRRWGPARQTKPILPWAVGDPRSPRRPGPWLAPIVRHKANCPGLGRPDGSGTGTCEEPGAGTGILLRRTAGCDIRTYGCVGTSQRRNGLERATMRRIGVGDPYAVYPVMHVLQGEMGEIHTCLAAGSVPSWLGTSSFRKGGGSARILPRGAPLSPAQVAGPPPRRGAALPGGRAARRRGSR